MTGEILIKYTQSRTPNSCQQFAPSGSAFHNWVSNVALFIIIPSLLIFQPPVEKVTSCASPAIQVSDRDSTIRVETSAKSSVACKTRSERSKQSAAPSETNMLHGPLSCVWSVKIVIPAVVLPKQFMPRLAITNDTTGTARMEREKWARK